MLFPHSYVAGHLLFKSSSLQFLFAGHFHSTCVLTSEFAHRWFNNILRVLVILSGVLEVFFRQGCDIASLSKYFPKFMIKISGLILTDQNTFLNMSTIEYVRPLLYLEMQRTNYVQIESSLQSRRKDISGKKLCFGTFRKI